MDGDASFEDVVSALLATADRANRACTDRATLAALPTEAIARLVADVQAAADHVDDLLDRLEEEREGRDGR